ncbi:hypothetical protein FQN54_004471 [Arachnomyces sp. PD_36]|nr:hypothetical protein FQN54_004471 [Arachnomyces sp. PD_36]
MADTTATPIQERPIEALPSMDGETSSTQQLSSPKQSGEAEPAPAQVPPPAVSSETAARLDEVLQSDVGISTLLNRLKQSIASARDFATFLRKRSSLEEDQAQGLKKLARAAHDSVRRIENRQGSYAQSYEEINRIHERMADHGLQFSASLQQMSDDLAELAASMERGRKNWKQVGLTAEKRVSDAEALAEKAKHKYDSLAEQYDRTRTGDRQTSGKFGLKGPKSAAQQEEEALRKVQNADADYAAKVTSAQSQRQELLNTHRPQAIRALQDLISECDAGLTLQLQKFATFNEKLLVGNGLCVSPLKDSTSGSEHRSLREVAHQIDNQKDFHDYVLSHHGKAGTGHHAEIKYERHPTLATRQPTPPKAAETPQPFSQPAPQNFGQPPPQNSQPTEPPTSFRGPDALPSPQQQQFSRPQASPSLPPPQPYGHSLMSRSREALPGAGGNQDLPPLNPVFGVSLDDLFRRDGTAVPMVVYQCLQAIELFGLDVEGIYRISGNATHISYLKSLFDNDSTQVDFTNPESFYHDVNSVAGLLKQFFRDLPDPLFTAEHYGEFIDAARIDDDIQRRDCLHAVINSLPDPNYATLRALTLHLNHVQERSSENRMNSGNIALCFGSTLMGSNTGLNIADAGWQARVLETILQNTFQIFDDD